MNMWGVTDRGVVREENQDSYALLRLSDRRQLAVVCDGMGGARAGNIASTMAVIIAIVFFMMFLVIAAFLLRLRRYEI